MNKFQSYYDLVETRLADGANRLWCYNTCLIGDIGLVEAAYGGYIETVKLLLESRRHRSKIEYSIRAADSNGHTEIVNLLFNAGGITGELWREFHR